LSEKLSAGAIIPGIALPTIAGEPARIGGAASRWRIVFVYRGLHCGVCKSYLARLDDRRAEFEAEGIDLVAVSGDTREQATEFAEAANLTIPVAYGLSVDQMKALGL
jgi:peroxiredoxin